MNSIDITNGSSKVGQIDLPEGILTDKVNKAVLYLAVKRQLAGKHHGTVRTKTRAEVDRSGKKIFRQKGTGNARHGSRKTAPFVGGGRVFGPKPRSFAEAMPKKVKRLAVKEALKYLLQQKGLIVVDQIPLTKIKTKEAQAFLKKMGVGKVLVVIESASDVIQKSLRNIKNTKVVNAGQLNMLDLLKYPQALFTSAAFEQIKTKYLM